MIAAHIKPGDRFIGAASYTVERVERVDWPDETSRTRKVIRALVVFDTDGGKGFRYWYDTDDAPLVREDVTA